jgi:hypothetical protein
LASGRYVEKRDGHLHYGGEFAWIALRELGDNHLINGRSDERLRTREPRQALPPLSHQRPVVTLMMNAPIVVPAGVRVV